MIKINKLQIIKRKRKFSSKEILDIERELESEDDAAMKCGWSILLDDKEAFQNHFSTLEKKRQEEFINFPIYNLIKN